MRTMTWVDVRIVRTKMDRKTCTMAITYAYRNGRQFTVLYRIGVDFARPRKRTRAPSHS